MTDRTYPRQAWVLQPSFRPKEITLVRKYSSYSSTDYGDESDTGKVYPPNAMFDTKADAIEAGHMRLNKQIATLDKQRIAIDKRAAALKKAEKQ